MLSYIVGWGENNRKEMHWEKNEFFVGQDFSSAFTEKQKSATETVVLSSSIYHNYMEYSKLPKEILVFIQWAFFGLGFLGFTGFLLQWLLCGFVVGFFEFGWLFNPVK